MQRYAKTKILNLFLALSIVKLIDRQVKKIYIKGKTVRQIHQRLTKVSLSTLLLMSLMVPETLALSQNRPMLTTINLLENPLPTGNLTSEPPLLSQAKQPRQGLWQRFRLRRPQKPAKKRIKRQNLWQKWQSRRQKTQNTPKKTQRRGIWQRFRRQKQN